MSKQLIDDVLDYFISHDSQMLANVNGNNSIETRAKLLREAREQFVIRGIKEQQLNMMIEEFSKYMWGYYVLDSLICNPDISDIRCMDYNRIRIKEKGVRKDAQVSFIDRKDYKQFVQLIAVKNRTNLSDLNAVQTFTDKDSNPDFILRFTITTEFVNSEAVPYVHIRKISRHKYRLGELIAFGMMSHEQAVYLKDKVIESGGILFNRKRSIRQDHAYEYTN